MNYDGGFFPTAPEREVDQYYLRSPSALTIVNYVLYAISLLSFSLNPHIMQKAFTAQHDWQVRFVVICLFCSAFLCMIPGVLTGITSISNFGSKKGGFQVMLAVFQEKGGFVGFLAYLAMLAGIAGISPCSFFI